MTATINTEGSRANVRTGPMDSPIIAKANPGDEFKVIGRSDDGEWWQVCCVRGPMDAEGEDRTCLGGGYGSGSGR